LDPRRRFGTARALAIDASGAIGVADSNGQTFSLRKYDPAGNPFWTVKNGPVGVGFRQAEAIATMASERWWPPVR